MDVSSCALTAVFLFISACKHATIPLSPHIKPPKAVQYTKAKPKKQSERPQNSLVGGAPPPNPQERPKTSSQAVMDKFPAFDPNWSADIQAKWFDAFSKMQAMLDE